MVGYYDTFSYNLKNNQHMKKILLSSALFLLVLAAFSQEKRNGDIYMEHPYINIVNNSVKAYLDKDIAANSKIFSDTAKFWASGMAKRNWNRDL